MNEDLAAHLSSIDPDLSLYADADAEHVAEDRGGGRLLRCWRLRLRLRVETAIRAAVVAVALLDTRC